MHPFRMPFFVYVAALTTVFVGVAHAQVGSTWQQSVDTLTVTTPPLTALSANETEKAQLQQQIADRNKRLKEVQAQLEQTRQSLSSTQGQRRTLQTEVTRLERTIRELELSIQSDELTVQRLDFEIKDLGQDVALLKSRLQQKQASIGAVLREVQKNTGASPLVSFLRTSSLATGIHEARALAVLEDRLSTDVQELKGIHESVVNKIQATDDRRQEIAERQRLLEDRRGIVQDQKDARRQVLSQTKQQETVYQKQLAALEQQQQQIASEVEALDASLRAKINKNILPSNGSGVLGYPIRAAKSVVTQGYGATAFARYGYRGQRHNGVDFGGSVGTPIYAAEKGTIFAAGNQDTFCPRGAYGRFIVINHDNQLTTLYGHLSRSVVSVGQQVERGELIGYMGQTGYATGPHLHFTVYAQSTFSMGPSRVCGPMPQGGDLNPLNYL